MSDILYLVRPRNEARKIKRRTRVDPVIASLGVVLCFVLPGIAMAGLVWVWLEVSPYLAAFLSPLALAPWLLYFDFISFASYGDVGSSEDDLDQY